MVIIDDLLVAGLRFVLKRIAAAVDQEMNDPDSLKEQLLAAQMRHELGEISKEEMAQVEAWVLERLRAIEDERRGEAGPIEMTKGAEVEVKFGGDE